MDIAVQADVTKENDMQRIVDKAVSQFGTFDILVNNAGIFDMLLPAGYVSDELWNKVIDINLTAPMQTIRKALPIFEKQGCRVIVNMVYIAGMLAARDGGAAYVASKYGIIGMAKNVAFNYMRRNIRINAVAPGRVNTNLRANSQRIAGTQDEYDKTISQWKDIEAAVKDGYVTNLRIAEPEEITRVLCF
jgi:NAD(P)-dependent dehydrogenase (short-subunit alcohol dehydrogenase family)